jgi:hypothetical protein
MTEAGVRKTLARIGEASALAFPAHPHMLRHAAGYKLASDGRDTRALQRKVGRPLPAPAGRVSPASTKISLSGGGRDAWPLRSRSLIRTRPNRTRFRSSLG